MAEAPFQLDDLELVERRTDVRIVLNLPGHFALASRRTVDGKRREFPCRVVHMTCHALSLATPVTAELGGRVIAHVPEFGKLEGPIIRVLDGGFIMELIMPKNERYELAAKIEWYDKRKNHDIEDSRRSARIIPRNPYSTLVLADGTTTDCLVKDVSTTGVAIHADLMPEIGSPVAVGKVVGRVVRRFSDGFAVHFIQEQDPEAVENLIARLS
jgi:hypothetical protein